MNTWLPSLEALRAAAALGGVLALLIGLGALLPRRAMVETQLLAGWGLACLVLTFWGVTSGLSLRIPLAGLAAAGAAGLVLPGPRARIGGGRAVWRAGMLALPMLAVMLAARPSQIDTWLNLLPNAAYLFFHDQLPTAARPPAYSFLPVAPYNTQFIAYATSALAGHFADRAMGLFNLVLQVAAGTALARVLAGPGRRVAWWQAACGLALAVPLNPGFVPRVFLAPYGEPGLAAALLFAVLEGEALLGAAAEGAALGGHAARLGLILAALLNIKQSGIGLMLPAGGAVVALALIMPLPRDGRQSRARLLGASLAALIPALALYGVWRVFADRSFVAGELKLLPFARWHFEMIPQILASEGREIVEKATLFLCLLGMLIATIPWQRRVPWGREARVLLIAALVTAGFNAFLLLAYVAHFDTTMAERAHSYFRYSSQLSLLMMLGLTLALRPRAVQWCARLSARTCHMLTRGAVALILLLPIAGAPLLRFDRDTPQHELWALGEAAARRLPAQAHLALLVPGDVYDGVGSFLRGVMLFAGHPARPHLLVHTADRADPALLARLAHRGFHHALVSCVPDGLVPGLHGGGAALLRFYGHAWHVEARWEYPPGLAQRHFAGLLAKPPLCAGG
ncbi:MAG: hypothetical protein KGL12_16925 [Rhodospirillales bacterium]|nr:hypothetical protein [Rhodospirillales bacterium]